MFTVTVTVTEGIEKNIVQDYAILLSILEYKTIL